MLTSVVLVSTVEVIAPTNYDKFKALLIIYMT